MSIDEARATTDPGRAENGDSRDPLAFLVLFRGMEAAMVVATIVPFIERALYIHGGGNVDIGPNSWVACFPLAAILLLVCLVIRLCIVPMRCTIDRLEAAGLLAFLLVSVGAVVLTSW